MLHLEIFWRERLLKLQEDASLQAEELMHCPLERIPQLVGLQKDRYGVESVEWDGKESEPPYIWKDPGQTDFCR